MTGVQLVGVMPVRSPQSRRLPFDSAGFLGDNKISGVRGGELRRVRAILGQSVRILLSGGNPETDVPAAARFLCDIDVLAAHAALSNRRGDDVGVDAVLADLDQVARRLAAIDRDGETQLRLLALALRRSAAILRLAPDQLPEQILFRLRDHDGPLLRRLVAGAERYKSGRWLRPLTTTADSRQETIAYLRGNASAACFERQGRLLVVDNSRRLECFDLSGARTPQPFSTGEGEPTALAADDTFAAIATRDGPIRVVELASGPRAALVPAGKGATLAVTFLRAGILVSAGTEGRVRTWDVAAGKEIGRFDVGLSVEALLPFDEDRLLIGTEPDDGTRHALQIWNLRTGRQEAAFGAHDWSVTALARAGETRLVLAVANDELSAWRLDDLACVWRIARKNVTFHSAACLPGRALVGDSVGELRLFDLRDGSEVGHLPRHSGLVPQIAVDAPRRRLVTVSYDQSVRLWDAAALERSDPLGHRGQVRTLAPTPDGARLLSGGNDGRILFWDARTGELDAEAPGHEHWVSQIVALSGAKAVSAGWDGTIRVWDLIRSRCVAVLKTEDPHLTGLACTADGRLAVTASTDGVIRVWDLERAEQQSMVTASDRDVVAVAIDGDQVRWMTAPGQLWSWRASGEPETAAPSLDARVTACDLGTPGRSVVAGLADGRLVTVAADGATEIVGSAECGPTAIAHDASGELMLAAFGVPHVASDNTARLWVGRDSKAAAVLVGDAPWTAAAVARDGRYVYLGDESGGVHIAEPVLPELSRRGPGPAAR